MRYVLIALALTVAAPAAAQTVYNCWSETYWCYDAFGNKHLCTRRVCR